MAFLILFVLLVISIVNAGFTHWLMPTMADIESLIIAITILLYIQIHGVSNQNKHLATALRLFFEVITSRASTTKAER